MNPLAACLLLLFVASAFGQQVVPCLTSQASCSSVTSVVSMINNGVYCCLPGFVMSWTNNVCSCAQTSDVFPCLSDPQQCRFADSFSRDSYGNTRCCLPDSFMSSFPGSSTVATLTSATASAPYTSAPWSLRCACASGDVSLRTVWRHLVKACSST